MADEKLKKTILEFIKKNRLAVISTVKPDNSPEAAVLEFGETDDLELIFDTLGDSRKAKNIAGNNRVAFVIGWDEDITVQYEGEAHELAQEELSKYQEIYFRKNPEARKWVDVPGIKFFKVVPKWIRLSDLTCQPWNISEVELS